MKIIVDRSGFALYNLIYEMRNYPAQVNKENAMSKENVVKKPRVSKKALIAEIVEMTGKPAKELDSLARSNIETIAWVKSLIS